MPDWTKPMQQTYEFYEVDPFSWLDKRPITTITSCSIERDASSDTKGSASFNGTSVLNDIYVRTYLKTWQNGIIERTPLGTHLVQTPKENHDGKISNLSMQAYTSLIELNENPPPFGFALLKDTNILDAAYSVCKDHMRAPVLRQYSEKTLYDNFVSKSDEKWLSFAKDLLTSAEHHFEVDELGQVLFAPNQEDESLRPVWTYTDDNSSILYPEIEIDRDYYNVPNVVEVVYSGSQGFFYTIVKNENPNSPVSAVARGREITYRDSNPSIAGQATEEMVQAYAENLLRSMSKIVVTLTYKHGYCPVRVNDCVYLNYERAGLRNVKARVISQSISCEPGCPVEETAVFTKNLMEG